MPDTSESNYLLNIFFEFGPATKDGPVDPLQVEAWGRALGVTFKPWQTRLFVQLSRAYCAAQFESTKHDAPCPWPEVEKMWHWARNQKAEQSLDREEKRLARKAAKLEK